MLRSTISQLCARADSKISLELFHTSAILSSKKGKPRGKGSSRTRLTKDLRGKPGKRSTNLEVAARREPPRISGGKPIKRVPQLEVAPRREFPRETVPHAGRLPFSPATDRSPSFRRGRRNDRSGKWERDVEHSTSSASNPHANASGELEGQDTRRGGVRHFEQQSSHRKPFSGSPRSRNVDVWDSRRDSPRTSGEHTVGRRFTEEKDSGYKRQEPRGGNIRGENMPEQNFAAGSGSQSLSWKGQRRLDETKNRQREHDHSTETSSKSIKTAPIVSELSDPTATIRPDTAELAARFTSPPLMPGILSCLQEIVGPHASPTPIQSLSMKWLLNEEGQVNPESGWKQFLLASETGSGKSIAYLLPVLQNLKLSEMNTSPSSPAITPRPGPKRPLNPRALILAPTHELSRQLASFAKALLHKVKLRVLCASRANLKSTKKHDSTARQMVSQFESQDGSGEFMIQDRSGFPVDVVVGTPMKLLEMFRGRGWDRKDDTEEDAQNTDELGPKPRRGRDKMVGFGKWRSKPEMGLANVEWVVVDEADVLFDPDFQETTRQLLADISEARGYSIPPAVAPPVTPHPSPPTTTPTVTPLNYPFNLIMTSATIPASLATYLDTHHPKLMRLASPRLHHLPKTLQTEYVSWSGGNKLADIERRIRRVWAEDSSSIGINGDRKGLSKVLIFCNRSSKVDELSSYLEEQGIKNIGLSSTSEHRKRGSNHHLDGFLKDSDDGVDGEAGKSLPELSDPKTDPHVMITTSLLSRGLDFSPEIRHVFIVDEPRNMIDFLHRAGRAARAGEKGKVVVFGKMKGRGSSSAKDVRKKVGSLIAH